MLALAQPLAVLLQRNFNNPPPQGGGGPELLLFLAIYGIALAIGVVIQVFFLLTLSKCLKEIAPKNRQMEPGQVWLNLIPIFNLVWMILTVIRLSDSLQAEFLDRRMREDGDFGRTVGLVYIISAIIGCSCVAIVAWIMYWVKIAGYSRTLRESGRRGDDFDDDRPRRRLRDDEDDDRGYRDERDD